MVYPWNLQIRTIIDPVVVKEFMGKEYLVLKVKYEEDSWYFFILTYAMEVYQFYHDETKTMENTSYLVNKKFTVESKYQNQNLVRKDEATDKLTKISALKT
jgi:hypothetical protein